MTDLAPSTYRREKRFTFQSVGVSDGCHWIQLKTERGRSHPKVIVTNKVGINVSSPPSAVGVV